VKKLLHPQVIVPTLLSAGFLAFVLTFANANAVSDEIATALPSVLVPVFLLMLLYLTVKAVQWRLYLARLGIRPGWQALLVPYAGGEMGNSLPMGVFVENYLLKGSLGSEIGRSSAATSWMLITEVAVCLIALLVVGVPGWPWLRPLVLAILLGMVLAGALLFQSRFASATLETWAKRSQRLHPLAEGAQQFLESGRQLFSWQTFVYGLPLTAIYLGAQVAALAIVGATLSPGFGWHEALAAFAFSLGVVLVVPLLPHLGSVEASGLGVLLQFGLSKNLAVGSFLTLRLLATGTILLVGSVIMLLLHHEVGLVMRALASGPEQSGEAGMEEAACP
jgi:uncharacterized membrane protein YbhN (UPF0104 family)